MQVVPYTPAHAGALADALAQAPFEAPLLRLPSYVQHYFLSHPACRLLLLVDDGGRVAATLGSERITLDIAGQRREAAVLSNTYAFRPGAFAFLFLHWMKSTPLGLSFPGNALMHELVARQQRWRPMHGLYTYWLNWDYPDQPGEPVWKRGLRTLARRAMRIDARRLVGRLAHGLPELVAEEVPAFDEAMARPGGDYGLRLMADADFLNWRFSTALEHVRYRVFRLRTGGRTRGSVVLADWPHCLVVSHCDGDDPVLICRGLARSVAQLNRGPNRYRKVLLTSMHATMQPALRALGFRPKRTESPLYLASFGAWPAPESAGDDWLVNMDLGDAGLTAGVVR